MKKNTPLLGKYLIKSINLFLFLKIINFISFFLFFFKKKEKVCINPKKILLSNIAHLGDVLIATSVLPVIKNKFPNVKIGFVCSPNAKDLIRNNKFINKVYLVDHWKLNRNNMSIIKKIIKYIISRSKAIKQIRKEKYDIAIDLYCYFPNTIYLFWKAKIPIRVGYTSAGFENFLTNRLDWTNQNKHISLYHFDLIKFLDIKEEDKSFLKMNLPLFSKKNKIELSENFIIFHIGAGEEKKKWNINKWKTLTKVLVNKGKNIVFTGKGQKENNQITKIINGKPNCINLCDKLKLQDLIEVINKAKFVICLDSLVLHISAVLNKNTIVIFCGINNQYHWILKKPNLHIISKKQKCSPCFKGCKFINCINEIEVEDVLNNIENIYV